MDGLLAGESSSFSWSGTFVAFLLPATVVGGLLGWAEYSRRTGSRATWRWTALTPLLFIVMLALVQQALWQG